MNGLRKGFSIIAVSICILGGCAMDPAARPWWSLREVDFRALQSGTTSKAEARAALGKPFAETKFSTQGEEVWDYRFPDGARVMVAWVYFDRSGIYKYYTAQPDTAYYGGTD